MHGRRRTDWRRQHSQRLAHLEDMRAAQQYKSLFRCIGLKERTAIPLDTLSTSTAMLTDANDIHLALTAHFQQWYRAPAATHIFAQQLHDPNWISALLDGTAAPLLDLPPSFQQQAFINSCRVKVTAEQRVQVQDATDAPLLWTEYIREIHLLQYGKAPGPSGVTATMIKSWPDAMHELVFSCLAALWEQRATPNWWLHSYLHPIPKKGAATLENLRPLGLYEITRKLLAAIIIKRAYRVWEKLALLHPHQHAYRRGMGTGTAILRLLNNIEDSTETTQPLLITAWDIKRAFDSIPHPFIRLALLRLGISDLTANWFLYLLQHNIVTVQSPYVLTRQQTTFNADPAVFNDDVHTSATAASFHQERGIGQGDTPSAIF